MNSSTFVTSFSLLCVSLALGCSCGQALAHGGGLNSDGCHNDRKKGGYHCHGAGTGTSSSQKSSVPMPSPRPNAPEQKQLSVPQSGIFDLKAGSPSRIQETRRVAPGFFSLHSVGDGDTIRVLDSNGDKLTIRLACIDAPEIKQGAAGKKSRAFLAGLLTTNGSDLRLKFHGKDRYGRTVAEVFSNGMNINLQMVRSGQAFVYRKYLRSCDGVSYVHNEFKAREDGLGVWISDVMYPWDFRVYGK